MISTKDFVLLLPAAVISLLIGCTSTPPATGGNPSFPGAEGGKNRIPMTHRLTTNDWETVDSIWGVNVKRHIFVNTSGFRLRVKVGPVGGEGSGTPGCVEYGGFTSVIVDTVQVKGSAGELVNFLQGAGPC